MKKIFYIFLAVSAVILGGCTVVTQTTSNNQQYSDPTFNVLNDYGQWIDVPGLGTVWRPYDENNWQPYYNGQWIWTDQGWMWQSNEPYGWVVYHYGNWDYTNAYGWVWLPNYVWEPARVRWYHQNGYVGWAPMPPLGTSSASIIYENRYVNNTWVFVSEQNFYDKQVGHYRARDFSPDMGILRSRDGDRGPELRNIENASHRRIEPINPVREEMKAGNRKLVRYRVPDNKSDQREKIRNNTGREEPVNTKPPAEINRRPEPNNPNRNGNQNVNPPVNREEPQKSNNNERERNNNNQRNTNGRNVNEIGNGRNIFDRERNSNIRQPSNPPEPPKPVEPPPNVRPPKPVEPPKIVEPPKHNTMPREHVNDSAKSKIINGRNVNNTRPEPKKNESKKVGKKRTEPKQSSKEIKQEFKKKEEKAVQKEKAAKNKTKKEEKKKENATR